MYWIYMPIPWYYLAIIQCTGKTIIDTSLALFSMIDNVSLASSKLHLNFSLNNKSHD